jgi:hypothetical protein
MILGAAYMLYLYRRVIFGFEYPGAGAARHGRHDDDDLGQRSDRALSRSRIAEPGALRAGRFARDNGALDRGGLKYFVLGALASGMLLYGASLVYGFAGTTSFDSWRSC